MCDNVCKIKGKLHRYVPYVTKAQSVAIRLMPLRKQQTEASWLLGSK